MTTRINHQNPHAEQLAQNEHTQQTHMQGVRQHAKFQRIKAQKAAFYRNKRFAAAHQKPASSGAQKLLRQLGTRPQPGQFAKARGKNPAKEKPKQEHEREDGLHEQKQQHEREQEHEQKRQHEHEHGQGHDDEQQQQQQQRGDERGQSQQHAPGDGQQRERREKRAKFAIKRVKTARLAAPLAELQALAERHVGSLDQPKVLAAAYLKPVLRLAMKSRFGPLLAPLLALNMSSPAVLKRTHARLHAHSMSTLALGALVAGGGAFAAAIVGHSLDMTLARQRFGITYGDDDQSLAKVKERLIEALAAMPDVAAAAASRAPIASEKAQEVRTAPQASGSKP